MSKWWVFLVLVTYLTILFLTPYDQVNAILYVNPLVRFADFYLGILLCRLYERGYDIPSPKWMELLLVVLLIAALVVYPSMDAKLRNAPLYWLVLVPLILVFAKGQGFVSSWLQKKPMLLLASLTMPLFMTHQMLIGILFHRFPDIPVVVMLFLSVFTVLVVSWIIDRFILRPLGRLI